MTTYQLESKAERECAVEASLAVFYVFPKPVPAVRADEMFRALDELERITAANAVLLQMAEACTPPDIPDDGDEACPW